jgi:hypothetical protein
VHDQDAFVIEPREKVQDDLSNEPDVNEDLEKLEVVMRLDIESEDKWYIDGYHG